MKVKKRVGMINIEVGQEMYRITYIADKCVVEPVIVTSINGDHFHVILCRHIKHKCLERPYCSKMGDMGDMQEKKNYGRAHPVYCTRKEADDECDRFNLLVGIKHCLDTDRIVMEKLKIIAQILSLT